MLLAYHGFMATPLPPGIRASFWDEYRKRIEAEMAEIRDELVRMESGKCSFATRAPGGEWKDITEARIAEHKRMIAIYEARLAALDKGELL
jgi:hypothetical protein